MTYPILVSPSRNPEVIIEFTSETTGRIVLAHPKSYNPVWGGYMSSVGYSTNYWSPCNDENFNKHRASWVTPDPSLYRLCPYIQDKYPELLL